MGVGAAKKQRKEGTRGEGERKEIRAGVAIGLHTFFPAGPFEPPSWDQKISVEDRQRELGTLPRPLPFLLFWMWDNYSPHFHSS